MEHYYHTLAGENWFDYEDVYRDAVIAGEDNDIFVELGSWRGKSAAFMGVEIINSGKRIFFVCVDNWSQGDTQKDFKEAVARIEEGVILFVLEGTSWEMADQFEDNTIAFCFVDAAHDYVSKTNDIKAWLPKIKKGGMIAGHDYTSVMDGYNRTYDAVNDTIGKENISVIRNVWIHRKK